jgi:hypothetical protein
MSLLIIFRSRELTCQQILSIIVVMFWIMVSIGTIRKVITGEIFVGSCLKDMDLEDERKKQVD